jgi:aspartyl-tRNA(Asn)/glutamyl-tRNA(Gln) amidotransferase subunit A
MSEAAELGVVEAAELLARHALSSRELTEACLARIRERDGAIGAWIRVYEESALAEAARADRLRARGGAPFLCGVPIALKDLYAVAGKPLTASSRVLDVVPRRSCDAWARLHAQGMVLIGHVHTHEFAAGGTTDQVGNPWALDRSPGGSSGGSAAALAARTVPAATGTDTAGSLRIPSAFCGTSTIKPTRGLVPLRGIVPLARTLDHAGPMARTVRDCEPLLGVLAGLSVDSTQSRARRPLRRVAVSPRIGELDPDVADGFDAALAALDARVVAVPPPAVELDLGRAPLDLLCAEMLAWHRRFDGRRELYRPSTRGFLEYAERRALTQAERAAIQRRLRRDAARFVEWLAEHRVDALVEPTVPIVARPRGTGYDAPFTDVAEVSLTHYWDWTGFPVVALPSGVGPRSGLPTGVSLIGPPGAEWDLLAAGAALQDELGIPAPYDR